MSGYKLKTELRQIAGLLLLCGFCALIQPVGNVVSQVDTSPTKTPLARLVGGFFLLKLGITSLFIGYCQLVQDWSHKYLTLYAIFWCQLAFVPYVSDMVFVGIAARDRSDAMIPSGYEAEQSDYNFVAAMGILSILVYGFAFVGSISFMLFSLHSFEREKPHNATYYRKRLFVYCTALLLAGFAQLSLGSYVMFEFGTGDLTKASGPIGVAMLTVTFPEMNIVVGILQVYNAVWGILRGGNVVESNDNAFAASVFFGWLIQYILQVLTQIGHLEGGTKGSAAAGVTAVMIGLNLMPAFLDYKVRSIPEVLDIYFYDHSEGAMERIEQAIHEVSVPYDETLSKESPA